MLRSLSIRNIALIDRADLVFSEGLNVLSGETGAGKSVILDSIDFALGAKANASMIRRGETECSVRAEFSVDGTVSELFDEFDLEGDDAIVISRKFSADGRGSIKVNGSAVSAAMLKKLTSRLVDVHGQSEHFFLLKESNQRRLLDRVAGENAALLKKHLSALLAERDEAQRELSAIGGDEETRARRLEVLRFQIDEIERAELREGEEAELTALKEKFRNAEKILNGLNGARECLLAEGGAADCVREAIRGLRQIARFGDYGALAERLESAFEELSDVGEETERSAAELDVDEREAERVEARLDELHMLKKKYGGSVSEIQTFLARAKSEAELLENGEERRQALLKLLGQTDAEIYSACVTLTEARKKCAAEFSEYVVKELKTLSIPSARFKVEFGDYTREDVRLATSEGLGSVRFLFSANAGEPLKPLGEIISGGEMSRFMLAVKALLGSINDIGTYIFDEIDAGIGGKTAKVIADKFIKIAATTQIVAVSHLAQIAAAADRQFLIEKTEAGEKTYTRVKELTEEERQGELARMLSGDADALSMEHAGVLLGEAKKKKEKSKKSE